MSLVDAVTAAVSSQTQDQVSCPYKLPSHTLLGISEDSGKGVLPPASGPIVGLPMNTGRSSLLRSGRQVHGCWSPTHASFVSWAPKQSGRPCQSLKVAKIKYSEQSVQIPVLSASAVKGWPHITVLFPGGVEV